MPVWSEHWAAGCAPALHVPLHLPPAGCHHGWRSILGCLLIRPPPCAALVPQAVTNLIADGYPAQEILLQLQAVLLEDGQAPDSGGWVEGWGGAGQWAAVKGCLAACGWTADEGVCCQQKSRASTANVVLLLGPHPAAKGKILGALAEADKNLVDGSDEFLQLLGAASYAQRVLTGAA